MAIISVAQTKGGAGKSTLVRLMSLFFRDAGYRVGVLDMDNQESVLKWFQRFPEQLEGITVDRRRSDDSGRPERALEAMRRMAQGRDVLIVDLPGFRSVDMALTIQRSNLVIVPSQPNSVDFEGTLDTVGLLYEAAETAGRAIPFRVVWTRCSHLGLSLEEIEYREVLDKGDIPYMQSRIFNLNGYHRINTKGILDPADKPLIRNAKGFFDEMVGVLTETFGEIQEEEAAAQG